MWTLAQCKKANCMKEKERKVSCRGGVWVLILCLWTRWDVEPFFCTLTAADRMIHLLIYIHAIMLSSLLPALCHLVKYRSLFYLSIHLSLSPSSSHGWKSLWCLYNPWSTNSWMFFFFNIQEALPKLCVVYQNEFCLQAATLSTVWKVSNSGPSLDREISTMTSLMLFGWVEELLIIMLPFDQCCWLKKWHTVESLGIIIA